MTITACTACRVLKIKCVQMVTGKPCKRCEALGSSCFIPPRILGRKLGSKNKKIKSEKRQESLGASSGSRSLSESVSERRKGVISLPNHYSVPLQTPTNPHQAGPVNDTDVDDEISNPLYILASEVCSDKPNRIQNARRNFDYSQIALLFQEPARGLDPVAGPEIVQKGLIALFQDDGQPKLESFGRVDQARIDVKPEYDAIELGLVSHQEAECLYEFFFAHLQRVLRILDPSLHSMLFVRQRSALLFAVILEVSAMYFPRQEGSTYKRLQRHVDWLIDEIFSHGYESVEICQALQIHSTWLSVPLTFGQQRTWQYISFAISMAIELRLDRPVPFCVKSDPEYATADATRRLSFARNSQRTWLCLYNWDRALASIRGRECVLPESEFTTADSLEQWHTHPLALEVDACTGAAVALRKLIATTQRKTVAELAIHPHADFDVVCSIVDADLYAWQKNWQTAMGPDQYRNYEIVLKFTRFLLLATPYERRLRIRSLSGNARDEMLLASLAVCKSAVTYLYNLEPGTGFAIPTHTLSMTTYVALFSVKLMELSGPTDGSALNVDLFHLAILSQLAISLTTVRPQNGTETSASIFGRRLLTAVRALADQKISEAGGNDNEVQHHSGTVPTSSGLNFASHSDDLLSSFLFDLDPTNMPLFDEVFGVFTSPG